MYVSGLLTLLTTTIMVVCSESLMDSPLAEITNKIYFDDVVNDRPCTRKTCRFKGENIIICCHLTAVNRLAQVTGLNPDIPENIRLHIVRIKDQALCTKDAGNNTTEQMAEQCENAKVKIPGANSHFFKQVTGLTISKTDLEYISEDFFGFFANVKHLVIDKNPKLKIIPAVNRLPKERLQTISYIGNTNVQIVNWHQSVIPELKEFTFSNFLVKAGPPTNDFYMGTFTPGDKFKTFNVRLNYLTAHVVMPTVDNKDDKLKQVYIGSTNIPENVHVNFTKFNGNIQECVYKFPTRPDRIVPDFLPYDFNTRMTKVSFRFDGESYELKNMAFRRKIPTERLLLLPEKDEQALLDVKRDYGTPKRKKDSKGRHLVKYFLLDTIELGRLVKDSHNLDINYIVKTEFLWIRDVSYLRKSVKLHLTFTSLIISTGGMLLAADIKPSNDDDTFIRNKEFAVAKPATFLLKEFDTASLADYLTMAASITQSIDYGDNPNNGDNMKRKLASHMLLGIKEKDILNAASKASLPDSDVSFIESAILTLPQLVEFTKRPLGKVRRIADISLNEFQQKTLLYQEISKTLITTEHFEGTNDKRMSSGLRLLTETSKLRVDILTRQTQLGIERALREEKEARTVHKKLKSLREKYLNEILPVKDQFFIALQAGNPSAENVQTLHKIQDVFDMLFAYHNVTKRKIISRPDLLSSIGTATNRVYGFVTSLEKIRDLIAEKYATMSVGNVTSQQSTQSYLKTRLLQLVVNRGFSNNDVMSVTSQLNDVDVNAVFQWDVIMHRVDKLLDLTLSAEVAETLAFKTAFLRLLDTAKVESEMLYEVTSYQEKIFLGNYTVTSLRRQTEFITKQRNTLANQVDKRSSVPTTIIQDSEDEPEDIADEFQSVRQAMLSQLKLDMITHISEYCSFIEYSTSSKCLLDKQLSYDGSLPNLQYLANELLVVTRTGNQQRVEEIAPQSFINIPIRYDFNENCEQVLKAVDNAYTETHSPWQQQPDSVSETLIKQPPTKQYQQTQRQNKTTTKDQVLQPAIKAYPEETPNLTLTTTQDGTTDKPKTQASGKLYQRTQKQKPTTKNHALLPDGKLRNHVTDDKQALQSSSKSYHYHTKKLQEKTTGNQTFQPNSKAYQQKVKLQPTKKLEAIADNEELQPGSGFRKHTRKTKPTLTQTTTHAMQPSNKLYLTQKQRLTTRKQEMQTYSQTLQPVTKLHKLAETRKQETTTGKQAMQQLVNNIRPTINQETTTGKQPMQQPSNKSYQQIYKSYKPTRKPRTTIAYKPKRSKKHAHPTRSNQNSVKTLIGTSYLQDSFNAMAESNASKKANVSRPDDLSSDDTFMPSSNIVSHPDALISSNLKPTSKTASSPYVFISDTIVPTTNIANSTIVPTERSSLTNDSKEEDKIDEGISNETFTLNLTSNQTITPVINDDQTSNQTSNQTITAFNNETAVVGSNQTSDEAITTIRNETNLIPNQTSNETTATVSDDETIDVLSQNSNQTLPAAKLASYRGYEDLLATWINDKLGIPNRKNAENSAKRSHFAKPRDTPVRTLDGVRVRRAVESNPMLDNYTGEFGSEIFNDAIASYMKRSSMVDSREQFESLFRKCNASKVYELKNNKIVTLTVTPNNKQFKGFERVHVEEVKVYLHGAETKSGIIEVNIKSTRILHDRADGKKKVFVGKSWNRNFRYQIDETNNTQAKETRFEIKADIHHNQNPHTFLPTPFTTWIISVSSERNPGLDLSKLTSIELLFSGSLVTSPNSESSEEQNFFQTLHTEAMLRPSTSSVTPTDTLATETWAPTIKTRHNKRKKKKVKSTKRQHNSKTVETREHQLLENNRKTSEHKKAEHHKLLKHTIHRKPIITWFG